MVPAGLNIAETMETGHIKNCGMTQEPRMFCEESSGQVNAKDLELFRNSLVHEFYCLKVLITLELEWLRKRRILMSKTLINGADGVTNWLDINFPCFIFSDERNDMPCSSLFLLSGNDVNFSPI